MKREVKEWKKTFAFRLKDGDEYISEFIQSSNKSDSDTIRELLRFAINEIQKKRKERLLEERFKELEEEMRKLKELQEKHHNEIINLLKSGVIINNGDQDSVSNQENDSFDSSIDNVFTMFNL